MREEVVEKLSAIKIAKGISISWLVNEAILEYLENHDFEWGVIIE